MQLTKVPADGVTRLTVGLGWDSKEAGPYLDYDLWYVDLAQYEVTLPRGKAGGQIVYLGDKHAAVLVMRRLAHFRPRLRRIVPPVGPDFGTIEVLVTGP